MKTRILIVEDEEKLRRVLQLQLRRPGSMWIRRPALKKACGWSIAPAWS